MEKVVALKLDGTKDGELYRILLRAQCNALHAAMPFLFERIDDETELLLPDNLLHSDSVIRQMVNEIDEADWQEIEIIGWLYQFYISEKKDEVIGKVVKSEDIPAATQLFTPNWIVKYMVQNTLGAKWLATYPQSGIRAKMEYYIEPAEQTDEVNAKLAEITPKELNPEEITFLDPACGSGHILVEAYDLFKEIYLERGYVLRDIPKLILEKNLFGLDIDDRAAQLACFALFMKARADDRRILSKSSGFNVMAIREARGLDLNDVCLTFVPNNRSDLLHCDDLFPGTLKQPSLSVASNNKHVAQALRNLLDVFENAKTFGSLITISDKLNQQVLIVKDALVARVSHDSLGEPTNQSLLNTVCLFVNTALILHKKYSCVVTNPPYMGNKYFIDSLKKYSDDFYKIGKGDLYTIFMMRCHDFTVNNGWFGMITIPNWMFLATFDKTRSWLLSSMTIETFCHNGRGVFGSDFGSCAFTIRNIPIQTYNGTFKRLFEKQGSVFTNEELNDRFFETKPYLTSAISFQKIPGSPISYWVSETTRELFVSLPPLGTAANARVGLMTSENATFLRYFWEVSIKRTCFDANSSDQARDSGCRWFPHNKGGSFRKWYGNCDLVVDWENNGDRIKKLVIQKYPYLNGDPNFVVHDDGYYFLPSVSWSEITISSLAFRYYPHGFTFNVKGMSAFPNQDCSVEQLLSYCNSKFASFVTKILNPTVSFGVNNFNNLPAALLPHEIIAGHVQRLIQIAKSDWNDYETSWGFSCPHILKFSASQYLIEQSYLDLLAVYGNNVTETQSIESNINKLIIDLYNLNAELTPDISLDEITLLCNPAYKYSLSTDNDDRRTLQRLETIQSLISYAIGCMMGRYSLDELGIIYANGGNVGFDPSRYVKFPADDDGIVPILQSDYFPDDAAVRFIEFLKVAWSPEMLTENIKFVADSLRPKSGETPTETIRRYFSSEFFKDHLKTYKKRPIYWLFSSGKEKAFEALVYLHRYNEGTLSRMRMEYVTPLQGQISSRIEQLSHDISAAGSTAARNKLAKEQEKLRKQQAELKKFDEELRHYADKRIKIDLDDGVKVNYGKFGTLLADVKAIAGGSDE